MPYDLIVFSHPVSGGPSSERRCQSVKTNSVIVVGLRKGQRRPTRFAQNRSDFSFSVAGGFGER